MPCSDEALTAASAPRPPARILLDIEGTTTRLAFVHEVLFPFAAERLAAWLARHRDDPVLAADLGTLAAERAADRDAGLDPPAETLAYLRWLMARDRKSGPLKSIQGRIWQEGYAAGLLRGEVFADVPEALARWTSRGAEVAIFSSGSELGQRLLFAHSTAGDLSRYLSAYFDTRVGAKRAASSYVEIARRCGQAPEAFLFLSDVVEELDAARAAGMATRLVRRPGNAPAEPGAHPVIASFDEVP